MNCVSTVTMRFPHYLFVVISSPSSQLADGTWSESTASLSYLCRCREEVNSKGQEVPIANAIYHHTQVGNASFRRYSSVIYLPAGTTPLPPGTTVVVANDPEGNSIRLRAQIQKFDPSRYHCRIWT